MVALKYGFSVIEHGVDCCPEPFGTEVLDHVPVVGETVTLHWLDGREAYPVRVLKVDQEEFRMEVIRT